MVQEASGGIGCWYHRMDRGVDDDDEVDGEFVATMIRFGRRATVELLKVVEVRYLGTKVCTYIDLLVQMCKCEQVWASVSKCVSVSKCEQVYPNVEV